VKKLIPKMPRSINGPICSIAAWVVGETKAKSIFEPSNGGIGKRLKTASKRLI